MKPELWHSRDFRALSDLGRLCFLALIAHADDYGRLKTDPAHIAETMLMGNLPAAIGRELDLMESRGMIRRYGPGEQFLALLNWSKHQHVDKPSASAIAEPPKFKRGGSQNKGQTEIKFLANGRERSRSARAQPIRSDQNRADPNGSLSLSPSGDISLDERESADRLFGIWAHATGHRRAVLTPSKRQKYAARRKEGFTFDELAQVVTTGWQNDPWIERPLHNEFELLLRDSSHVEKFLKLATDGPPVLRAPKSAQDLRDEAHLREYQQHRQQEASS